MIYYRSVDEVVRIDFFLEVEQELEWRHDEQLFRILLSSTTTTIVRHVFTLNKSAISAIPRDVSFFNTGEPRGSYPFNTGGEPRGFPFTLEIVVSASSFMLRPRYPHTS